MIRIILIALLLAGSCNYSTQTGETGDDCTFLPEKETIEVESTLYPHATGNAVVAIVTDEKHSITNVVIRYIEVMQNGKLSRITDNINREKRPELAAAIDEIEKSARNGKVNCGKDRVQPAQLQYLAKLSFR
jgi:hypothetical protein